MSDKLLTWEESVQWLRNQPERTELVKACYYDDPLEVAAERFAQSGEWQAITKLLQPYLPAKVLDLGAGRGISSYAFAKAGCRVTALEPDPSPLVGAQAIASLAQASQLPIEIISEYGEQLPFPDQSFDIVYGRAVLHHAKNLQKLCAEAARVLKPGGVFLATREHILSQTEDLQAFLDSHPLHHLYGGEHAYLLQEYTRAIERTGLQLKKVLGCYESIINYAPMPHSQFQQMTTQWLAKHLPKVLASKLASTKVVQHFYGTRMTQANNAPGRLYSFLAVKLD